MWKLDLFFALFYSAFALYFFYVVLLYKGKLPTKRLLSVFLWSISIVVRLLLFFTEPYLTDDIYRYYFDGKMVSHGINPYHDPPSSDSLQHLHDDISKKLNHPDINTSYPPLAELIFFLGYNSHPSLKGIKFILVLFDLMTIGLLFLLLKKASLSLMNIFVYTLNPLVITEFYHGVHLESAVIFFLILAFYLIYLRQWLGAILSLVAALLTKFYGLFIFPLVFLLGINIKKLFLYALVSLAMLMAIVLPFNSPKMFYGLDYYQQWFEFNGGLYHLVHLVIEKERAIRICQLIALVAELAFFANRFWTFKKKEINNLADLSSFFIWPIMIYLLCTPTLYPWYLVIIVPFLMFYRKLYLIIFTGSISLSYIVLYSYKSNHEWVLPPVVILLEYLPVFILVLLQKYKLKNVI